MAISTYTPTGIIHNTSVDFTSRPVSQPIHIVQYDDTLPTLAVEMYQDGQSYALSADATAVLRFGKKDSTFVIVNQLGCSEDRTILYFAIDVQMTIIEGEYRPVIEVTDNSHVASSSPVYMVIDRNPVQRSDIESKVEFKQLVEYRDEAQTAAGEAKESETAAKTSEVNADASAKAAAQAASSVRGVKYSKSQWYLSTSATEETGGKWVDTMPELTAGKYLWNRTFTDYSDGSSTTSVAVVVTGIDALRDAIADEVTRAQTAEKDNATAITTEENRAKAAEGIKANKPSYVDKILASSGWSDGVFSFDTDYPFASYDLKVFLSPNATDEQYKAWSKAGVNTGSETANSIKAFGTIPTVDIPILLKVVEK